jgi:hypothetical protein
MQRTGRPWPTHPSTMCKMTTQNRLLMILEWMAHYPTEEELAVEYGIAPSVVSEDVKHILPILESVLHEEIRWPNAQERFLLRNTFPGFGNVIGCVDATHHFIEKPSSHQGWFFRHDKQRHGIVSQIVCDYRGKILHVYTGVPGAHNDLWTLDLSEITSAQYGFLSQDEYLLADSAYRFNPSCFTPYLQVEVDADPSKQAVNDVIHSLRAVVECSIGYVKMQFAVTHFTYRHGRRTTLSLAIVVACQLSNFVKRIRGHFA